MSQYDKKFLGYGFGQHKGYPTKLHKQKIQDIGPCVLHRKFFWLRSLSFSDYYGRGRNFLMSFFTSFMVSFLSFLSINCFNLLS